MSNVVDIAPELLDKIQKDFKKSFQNDETIKEIYGLIQNGLVSYEEANQFSIRCGELLSQSYLKYLTYETLPEGKLWFNIAEKILTPTLSQNYDLITEVCSYAQENVNKASGVSIKYIKPEINQNKIDGFIDKVSSYDNYDDAQWMLKEPVVNYSQSVVDDSIRTNADFHAKSGLTPQLVRKVDTFERRVALKGKTKVSYSVPCQWCMNLAGTFDYYSAPSDIYRRHENCRCRVMYVSDKKKQDVWSKNTYDDSKNDRIEFNEANQNIVSRVSPIRISEAPASLISQMNEDGEISYKLSKQNYDNHVMGTRYYERKRLSREMKGLGPQSVLTISMEEAQDIINKQSGTGILNYDKNGELIKTEKITCDKIVGMYYNKGKWYETNKAQIHHSKKGSHLVPIKGNDYD